MCLPSCEQIRRVTDVKSLQEACESLVRLVEKEKKSKQQYRQSASALKRENEALGVENQCLKLKNETLSELAANGNTEDIAKLRSEKEELERQLAALKEGRVSDAQKEVEETLRKENEELRAKCENTSFTEQLAEKDAAIAQFENDRKILEGILESNKAKAKERIGKLKDTIDEMTESHRIEIDGLRTKVDELSKENEWLVSEKTRISDEGRDKLNKARTQKKNWKQKVVQIRAESDTQRQKIEELEIKLHDEQRENQAMIGKIADLEKKLQGVVDSNDRNNSLAQTIQKLNAELFDMKQAQLGNEEFKAAIADRDTIIANLKEQVQKLMKMGEEKSTKITELRSEVCALTEKVAELSSGDSAKLGLAQMEREKAMLEEKINRSQASEDLKRKNQQLQEMIERSNALYVQVKEENRELRSRLKGQKRVTFSMISDVVFDLKEVQMSAASKKKAKKLAQTAYLERVLRQFFTEDEGNRAALVPVILRLINCNNEQIEIVKRQWERTTNPFHRLLGW